MGVGKIIAGLGGRPGVERLVTSSRYTRSLRGRFTNDDAVAAVERAQQLAAAGVLSTLHMRRGPVERLSDAESFVRETEQLVDLLDEAAVPGADISVKMEQLGYLIGGESAALANLKPILAHACRYGVTVTLDMEYQSEVEDTLRVWRAMQSEFGDLGIAIQSYLPRSEQDCADLARRGARVRLCKGGYQASGDGSFATRHEVDLSFVRCARRLLSGDAYPMFATHDPRLLRIISFLVDRAGLSPADWEIQTLQGVAPSLVAAAVAEGLQARCYLPYGAQTYPWLLHRVEEKPSNLLPLAAPSAWGGPAPRISAAEPIVRS